MLLMEKEVKTDKASLSCLISSRLDVFFVSVIYFLDACRFLKLHIRAKSEGLRFPSELALNEIEVAKRIIGHLPASS